jgi:arsenate reductase (thioredoxin)
VKSVLFLCVANSARSQMAEGLARKTLDRSISVRSAGSSPRGVNPLAVRVLAEIGIDIGGQRAKAVESIDLSGVDTVVTLCAEEVCPVVPGMARRLHWPLPDPAAAVGTEEERLKAFREVRDELARRIRMLASEAAGTGR